MVSQVSSSLLTYYLYAPPEIHQLLILFALIVILSQLGIFQELNGFWGLNLWDFIRTSFSLEMDLYCFFRRYCKSLTDLKVSRWDRNACLARQLVG